MSQLSQEEIQESRRLRHALLPTLSEALTLLFGSFLLLVGINLIPAIKNNVDGQDYSMLSDYIRLNIERLLAPTNNQQGSTILTVVMWMMIGIIAYVLVWVVISTINAYRSDVKASRGLVLPEGSSTKKVSHEVLLRLIVRLFATVMFLYWLYLVLASILPYTSRLVLDNLGTWTIPSVAKVVFAAVMLAASVFIQMIYARCIVLRERVFGG